MRKSINKQWWCYGAIFMMAVAFFLISRFGFLWSDDYAMGFGEVFAFSQVLSKAKWFYLNWGGGVLGAASQYLFCGLLGDHKIWFDLVNTMVFVLLVLVCGKLIGGEKEKYCPQTLCFALLFWFLCPVPKETVFWMVGSIGYLWVTTLVFLFLAVFFKYKDGNFGFGGKLLLFLISMAMAASVIPCVSICGAFVVYYLFRLKRFRGNAVPLVIGFAIGTLIIVLAPGNFVRAAAPDASYPFHVKLMELLRHPIREVLKFKALWLFVVFFLFGLKENKQATMAWAKKNAILLLTLAWSIIAFSLVFRPANRALFFTETLSLILAIRFAKFALTTQLFKFSSSSKMGTVCCWIKKRSRQMLAVLFIFFVLDAGCAIRETITQHKNNDRILAGLKEAGGVDGVDVCVSSHRMAYAPDYPDWSWKGIAYQLELDSVHLYPYYCQDKYYGNSSFGEEVYVDEDGLLTYVQEGDLNDMGILFFRVPDVAKDSLHSHASFTIEYNRPHKWYRTLLPNGKNYQYERTAEVVRDTCNVYYAGYDYYFVWLDRDNVKGLRSVSCDFE